MLQVDCWGEDVLEADVTPSSVTSASEVENDCNSGSVLDAKESKNRQVFWEPQKESLKSAKHNIMHKKWLPIHLPILFLVEIKEFVFRISYVLYISQSVSVNV